MTRHTPRYLTPAHPTGARRLQRWIAGTIALAPADAFVGWLPQEHERVDGETVAQYIARRTGCAEATREMDATAAALSDPTAVGADDAYATALERWLASGAADLDEASAGRLFLGHRHGIFEVAEQDVDGGDDVGKLGNHLCVGRREEVDHSARTERNFVDGVGSSDGQRFEEISGTAHLVRLMDQPSIGIVPR
jgi:hypothetical protein